MTTKTHLFINIIFSLACGEIMPANNVMPEYADMVEQELNDQQHHH